MEEQQEWKSTGMLDAAAYERMTSEHARKYQERLAEYKALMASGEVADFSFRDDNSWLRKWSQERPEDDD